MSSTEVEEVAPRIVRLFKLIKIGLSVLLIGAVFIGISMGSLKISEQNANQSAQSAIHNAEVQARGILASDTCLDDPAQILCLQAEEIIDNPTNPVTIQAAPEPKTSHYPVQLTALDVHVLTDQATKP